MRLALAQYAMSETLQLNLEKSVDYMRCAQRERAAMVLFPELCLSPFFPQHPARDVERYVNSVDDVYIRGFQVACHELGLVASPNVYLREGSRLFDASLFIGSDGAIQGISKMVHIAQVPGFYEQDYYTPSDSGFRVYATPWGRIGIVICFDRHYPESIRTCVLRGASLILIPTANTMDEPRDIFECELRAAAIQNGVYIAMCNRIGPEGSKVFCGESMIVDPDGEVTVKGGFEEALITADVDFSRIAVARAKRPYLSLRNPEMYERGEKEPRGFV